MDGIDYIHHASRAAAIVYVLVPWTLGCTVSGTGSKHSVGSVVSPFNNSGPLCLTLCSYVKNYAVLLLVSSIFYSVAYAMFTFGSLRAAKVIHDSLIDSVTRTTLRSVSISESVSLDTYEEI